MASPHAHAGENRVQFRQRFLGELIGLVSRTKTQGLSAKQRLSELERIFKSVPDTHVQHAFHRLTVTEKGYPCRLTAETGKYFRDKYSLAERKLGLGILAAQLEATLPDLDQCSPAGAGQKARGTVGARATARVRTRALNDRGAPSIQQKRRWLTKKHESPNSHSVFRLALDEAAKIADHDARQRAIEAAFRGVPADDAAWLLFRLRKGSADGLKTIVGQSKFRGAGRTRGMKILRAKASGEPESVGSTSVGGPPKNPVVPRSTAVTAAARSTQTPTPNVVMSDEEVILGIDFGPLARARAALENVPGGYSKMKTRQNLRRGTDPTIGDHIPDLKDFDEAAYQKLMDDFVAQFAKVAAAIGRRALVQQMRLLKAWRRYYQQPGSAAKLHDDPTLREARRYWAESRKDPPPKILRGFVLPTLLSGTPHEQGRARLEAERLYKTISTKYGPFLGPESYPPFKERLLGTKTAADVRSKVTEEIDRRIDEVNEVIDLLLKSNQWVYAKEFEGHRQNVLQMRRIEDRDLRAIIADADVPDTWASIADKVLTVLVFALSLLPAGWPLRLAQIVAAGVAIAVELEAHDRAVAAKTVGFAREYPSAIWIVLAVVGLGADAVDVVKFLRRAPSQALVNGGAKVVSEALKDAPVKNPGQVFADPKLSKIRASLVELAEAEALVERARKAAGLARPKKSYAGVASMAVVGFPIFPSRDQYIAYALAEIRRGTLDFKLFVKKLKAGPAGKAYAKLSKDQRRQLLDGFAEAQRILRNSPGDALREMTKVIRIADIDSRLFKELPGSLGGRQPPGYRLLSDPVFPSVVQVSGPGGAKVYLSRQYDATKGLLVLDTAMVSRGAKVPATPGGFELLSGRGTPAMTYYSVAQMKAMGIPHGSAEGVAGTLELVKTGMIDNLESLAQLHRMRRRWPKAPVHKLVEKTSTYRYIETTLGLAGYKIDATKVGAGPTVTFGELAEHWEKMAPRFLGETRESRRLYHDKLLKEYGVTRDTPVAKFTAKFEVSPGAPRAQAGRLRKQAVEFTEAAKARWKSKLQTRPPLYDDPALDYEAAVTGDTLNYRLGKGDDKIWADGLDLANDAAVEVKFVKNPAKSAVILDSKVNEKWRYGIITPKILDEMERYAKVIADPKNPIKKLFFYVSDARAVEYFEGLMRHVGVPGEIRVVTVEALVKAGKMKPPT